MADLTFLGNLKPEIISDLSYFDAESVPEKSGVYILIARGTTMFPYPGGKSPVFYIGQAQNLRQRLRQHHKYYLEAKNNRKLTLYWPRYEYAAKFGAVYTFILTKKGSNPKRMEDEILGGFAKIYKSFPVANGAGAWSRIKDGV